MGKKLGEMTPAERRAATERALGRFQAELTAAAPRIAQILAEAEDDYDPDLARMEDDGWGCAITTPPAPKTRQLTSAFVTITPDTSGFRIAAVNQAYVRMLLASRQPAFAAALEMALRLTETTL